MGGTLTKLRQRVSAIAGGYDDPGGQAELWCDTLLQTAADCAGG